VVRQTWRVITGDSRATLATLPACSVHCCVTSPPYFGLRDYGVEGQMGLEKSPAEFVAGMVGVFREFRRVLRDDGTLWINIGDSYAGSGRGGYVGTKSTLSSIEGQDNSRLARQAQERGSQKPAGLHEQQRQDGAIGRAWVPPPDGMRQKCLMGMPWRLALALQDDGWYLRQDIIWAKPNPMPESVTDRCTKAHEYIFLLSKSPRYFYDAAAIAEPSATVAEDPRNRWDRGYEAAPGQTQQKRASRGVVVPGGWDTSIGEGGHGGMHRDGARRGRKNGPKFGGDKYSELESQMHRTKSGNVYEQGDTRNARSVWTIPTQPSSVPHYAMFPEELPRRCIKAGCPVGGVVLDPFSGMATTGKVALELGRSYVGIELNPKYADDSRERMRGVSPLLALEAA
jgi:DNA modification methylase